MSFVTLRDGSRVPQDAVNAVLNQLETLDANKIALSDLYKTCKDSSYKIVKNPVSDSKKILKKLQLIGKHGAVHDIVKKVVLNSIEGSGFSLSIANPLKGEAPQPISRYSTTSKCAMLAFLVVGVVGAAFEYCRRNHPEYIEMIYVS